jgi:hypothetical protein
MENKLLRKQNFSRSAVYCLPSGLISWLSKCFQDRDFSFWITVGIGLTMVCFHFWPQKQITSGSSEFYEFLAPFWLPRVILTNFQCFRAWFDVKFYIEFKKIYFMRSKVQLKAIRAQKRNLLVMKFL